MPPLTADNAGATVTSSPVAAVPRCAARLLPLDRGLYSLRLAAAPASPAPGSGLALPAVQICQPPGAEGRIEITDTSGRAASWLGGQAILFASVPLDGGAVLITAHLVDDPVELTIGRLDAASAAATPDTVAPPTGEWLRLTLAAPAAATPSEGAVGLDTVAHIRGRGDVRFVDTPWVGRLGGGLWIEALTLLPHDPSAAAAIEYKALSVGGGETQWTGCGVPCGSQGRGLPLIGIAVRQKAGSINAVFDCEYTGYFQSGATVGPARNGAPCRSAVDGDPLEGLQLRITRRPPPPRPKRR